jgi:predicted nucleotide-binding protein
MADDDIPALLKTAIQKKLGNVTPRHVNRVIAGIASDQLVSRRAAAMLLARKLHINFSRFATAEDRAEMRGHSVAQAQIDEPMPAPQAAPVAVRSVKMAVKTTKNNTIFVVHGRDHKLNEDMFTFLRSLGLNAIEFSEAIAQTPGANPNITKVVKGALKRAQGVLVMFSPDEEARLKGKHRREGDSTKLESQSRLNVIFEAGIALGAHPEKTLLVEIGKVRNISDIAGMHIPRLTNDPASRKELAQRLRSKLKLKVNTNGDYWLKVGNFTR